MNRLEELISMFEEIPEELRCPHIKRNKKGFYCARNLEQGRKKTPGERKAMCDPATLQLCCLNEDYAECPYVQGEKFYEN